MAANKYDALCRIILHNVGGKENILNVTHCITRLRFTLRDESKAQTEILESTDGVVAVINANGQYQVVVGNDVEAIYDEFLVVAHIEGGGEVDVDGHPVEGSAKTAAQQNIAARIIDLVSNIIAPTLPVLAASGIIKGILGFCSYLGLISAADGAYLIWNAVGDGFFYFLPILLGYTASKKFRCSEFIGMAIGISLVYPTMVNLTGGEAIGSVLSGTPFEMNYFTTFFGIPVIMPTSGYTSSVIPIILAVWVASHVEGWLRPRIPAAIKMFIVPFLVLALCVPLTYLVVGPIATTITNAFTALFTALYNIPAIGGALTGLVIGGLWQVLVIFGFHWAVISLGIINLSTQGFDALMPLGFVQTWSQTFIVLAIYLRTRDARLKGIALPAFVSGLFGITEPAIYGVTLPKKTPFIASCVISSIVSAVIGFLGTIKFSSGVQGIFGLAMFIDPSGEHGIENLVIMAIAVAVIIVVSFVYEFITYRDEPVTENA